VFFVVYVLSMMLLGSASVLNLAGGALFGPVWGMALNCVAIFTGGVVNFYIGRYLARDFVQRRIGGRFKQILDGAENEGWRFVTFVRLVPIFHYASVSYAIGATRLRFREFAVPTAICLIPGTFAFTWLGHTGREATSSTEDLIVNAMLAIGLIAVLAFIPRLITTARRRYGIEYEDVLEIHRAGEAMSLLVLSSESATQPLSEIDVETIAETDLDQWIEGNRASLQMPFVVAAENESLALKAMRRLRKAEFGDVRYLFGGFDKITEPTTSGDPAKTALAT
jgi:uncharacterized membrane protein YdjX (TVP38/TMEM64 family)